MIATVALRTWGQILDRDIEGGSMTRVKLPILLASVLAVGLLAVVACAPEATAPGGGTPASQQEVITWNAQYYGDASEDPYRVFEKVCAEVTSASGGRLVMKPFVGGAICPATEEFDALAAGVIPFANTDFMYTKDKFPSGGLLSYRIGGMGPLAKMNWYIDGGGEELANRLIQDYPVQTVGLPIVKTAELFLSSASKRISSVADIAGLKIRAAGDGAEILQALGASIVFVPAGEIYEATQRGVVDAYECSNPTTDWLLGLQEAAKYVIVGDSRQPSEFSPYFVNTDAWEELSPDLQTILSSVITTNTVEYFPQQIRSDIEALENFRQYGCEVYRTPEDIVNAMQEASSVFYGQKSAQYGGIYTEILQSMVAYQQNWDSFWA